MAGFSHGASSFIRDCQVSQDLRQQAAPASPAESSTAIMPSNPVPPTKLPTAATPRSCIFESNMDYGNGSREHSPANSRDECCEQCHAQKSCAAAIFVAASLGTNGTCWYKLLGDLANPKASKLAVACVLPGSKTASARAMASLEVRISTPFLTHKVMAGMRKAMDTSSAHPYSKDGPACPIAITSPRSNWIDKIGKRGYYLITQHHTGITNQLAAIADGYMKACEQGVAAVTVPWIYSSQGHNRPQLDLSTALDLNATNLALHKALPKCANTLLLPRKCAVEASGLVNFTGNHKELSFNLKGRGRHPSANTALATFVLTAPATYGWRAHALLSPFKIGAALPPLKPGIFNSIHFNLVIDWLLYKNSGQRAWKRYFFGDPLTRIAIAEQCCSRDSKNQKIKLWIANAVEALANLTRQHLDPTEPVLILTSIGKDPKFKTTTWILESFINLLPQYNFMLGQSETTEIQLNAISELSAASAAKNFVPFPSSMFSWLVAVHVLEHNGSVYKPQIPGYHDAFKGLLPGVDIR